MCIHYQRRLSDKEITVGLSCTHRKPTAFPLIILRRTNRARHEYQHDLYNETYQELMSKGMHCITLADALSAQTLQ